MSGEGRVFVVPDMAVISMGASFETKRAQEAMEKTSDATAAILEVLDAFDVAPRDIQTSDLSLTPIWANRGDEDGRPRIKEYHATNRLTVRIRDLDKLGDVLDAVLDRDATVLGGLRFTVSDPEPQLNEARRLAVADARAKATLYADAAGVALGELVSLNESGARAPRPETMSLARAADAGVPIAQGETEIRASVTLVYQVGSQ